MTLVVRYDGSIVVGGIAGRDPAYSGNGLPAAARLNPDGTRHALWASPEDVFGGTSGHPALLDTQKVLGRMFSSEMHFWTLKKSWTVCFLPGT